ncbi:MAG: ATP-dependent Clp protease adapter ClpS [Lentisphaeria bacterium]|nr:ATP-dependent Clp protease adapter ClpS [Lentisphaeria bacterium]
MAAHRHQDQHQRDEDVQTRTDRRVRRPPLYRVLLHNDDYTPMDFVVGILKGVFRREEADAVRIMLNVHKRGVGVAGVYPHEVAETKVAKVHTAARAEGHPLRCSMEEA